MKRVYLGVIFLIFSFKYTKAQTCATNYDDPWKWASQATWFTGNGLFIHFPDDGGDPTFSTKAHSDDDDALNDAYEGTTAISDNKGNLVAWSNGRSFWREDGGDGILVADNLKAGNEDKGGETGAVGERSSAVQGIVAARHPNIPNKIFVFTSDDALSTDAIGVYYSVYDIEAQTITTPVRLLDNNGSPYRSTEQIDAGFHANGNDIWVVVRQSGSSNVDDFRNFYSYLITCDGLNTTPVKSDKVVPEWGHRWPGDGKLKVTTMDFPEDYERGALKISWDGSKIATCNDIVGGEDDDESIMVFDFDNETGLLSNCKPISRVGGDWSWDWQAGNYSGNYDLEWAPNSRGLYVAKNQGQLNWFDTQAGSPADINNSGKLVTTVTGQNDIRLASNDKIYCATGGNSLHVISFVNRDDLNNGNNASSTTIETPAQTSKGLSNTFIPPRDFLNLSVNSATLACDDGVIDLNVSWQCQGGNAEDTEVDGWSADCGGCITDAKNGIFDPTVAGSGTHSVIYSHGATCTVSDTIKITVSECADCVIDDPDLGADISACAESKTELDAGSGYLTYTWFQDNVEVPGETGQTYEAEVGVVRVDVTNTEGCSASASITITSHSSPSPDLGPDTTLCGAENGTITLGPISGFESYEWNTSDKDVSLSVSSEGTYSITVTDDNGCEGTDEVFVSGGEFSDLIKERDTTVCEGDNVVLDVTHPNAISYTWSPISQSGPEATVGSATQTYSIALVGNAGCNETITYNVIQADADAVDLGGHDTICDNVTKTLDAGPGNTYIWYLDGEELPSETSRTVQGDSGEYVVIVTMGAGCEVRDTAKLDNYQVTEVNLIATPEFCNGDSVALDAGISGAVYDWSNGESSQVIQAKENGTITVDVTDTNNCVTSGGSEVTVFPLPEIDLGPNSGACEGLETELDATPAAKNGVSYVWSNDHSGPVYTLIGSDTLKVVVTDANTCVDSATIEIEALEPLDLSSLPTENTVCERYESDNPLNGGDFTDATYTWTLPDDAIEEGQSIVPYQDGIYVLNVTDKFNCSGTHEFTNAVIKLPVIDLGPDTVMCSLGQERLDIRMIVDPNAIGLLIWEDSFGNTDNNNENDTIFTVDFAPITITGTLEDEETGCKTDTSVFIDEFCSRTDDRHPDICIIGHPDFPAGCSPYIPGDDENPPKVDFWNHILWSNYEVYNRWGLKVYQSKDLLPSWDGYFEHERAASGVYYFVYRYEDSSRKVYYKNGFFHLYFY